MRLFMHSRRMQSQFAKERDWDQFHQPRNLLLAMVSGKYFESAFRHSPAESRVHTIARWLSCVHCFISLFLLYTQVGEVGETAELLWVKRRLWNLLCLVWLQYAQCHQLAPGDCKMHGAKLTVSPRNVIVLWDKVPRSDFSQQEIFQPWLLPGRPRGWLLGLPMTHALEQQRITTHLDFVLFDS